MKCADRDGMALHYNVEPVKIGLARAGTVPHFSFATSRSTRYAVNWNRNRGDATQRHERAQRKRSKKANEIKIYIVNMKNGPIKALSAQVPSEFIVLCSQMMLNHTAASTITIIRTNKFSKSSINHAKWRRMKPKRRIHCVYKTVWCVADYTRHSVRRTLRIMHTRYVRVCVMHSRRAVFRIRDEFEWVEFIIYFFQQSNSKIRFTDEALLNRNIQFNCNSFPYLMLFQDKFIFSCCSIIVIEHQFSVVLSYRNK